MLDSRISQYVTLVVVFSINFYLSDGGPLYDFEEKSFVVLVAGLVIEVNVMAEVEIMVVYGVRGVNCLFWNYDFWVTISVGAAVDPDSLLSLNPNHQFNLIPNIHVARVVSVIEVDGALLKVWLTGG